MNNGKLQDVLIEDSITGLTIWADPDMKDIISSVPGVSRCGCVYGRKTQYNIFLDPRYDVKWVKNEIIARIKIGT